MKNRFLLFAAWALVICVSPLAHPDADPVGRWEGSSPQGPVSVSITKGDGGAFARGGGAATPTRSAARPTRAARGRVTVASTVLQIDERRRFAGDLRQLAVPFLDRAQLHDAGA